MVNETMVDDYNEKRIQELEAINAELLKALEAAIPHIWKASDAFEEDMCFQDSSNAYRLALNCERLIAKETAR